jgi:hypothetical protein
LRRDRLTALREAGLLMLYGLVALIGVEEILFVIGLGLCSVGAARIHPAAGWLLPGAILVWIAMPSRPSLIRRPPSAPTRRDDAEPRDLNVTLHRASR